MQIASRTGYLIACLACLLILVLSFSVFGSQILNTFGAFEITEHNRAYLSHAAQANRDDLHTLGETFAVLEVLSSAELGVHLIVDANIEVGQSLRSLGKALGIALAVTLAASVLLECWSIILTVCDQISPILFQLSLAFCILLFTTHLFPPFKYFKRAMQDIAELLVIAFLIVYFVFPYAVNVTGWLTQDFILSHSILNAQQKSAADAIMSIRPTENAVAFWSDSKNWRAELASLHQSSASHTRVFFDYIVSSTTYFLLAGVFFPLAIGAFIWVALRRSVVWIKECFVNKIG